ncbi:MAG: hypothetical protein FWE12_05510 [Oscillospiraceae bacterium]|nr:hypothetical protein [Oscillospiraceae bacterium]
MMKKIGAILLVLLLVVTLAACGGGTTATPTPPAVQDPQEHAFEAYLQIMNSMNLGPGQDGAYDLEFTMDMTMDFMGETIHSVTHGHMQMIVEGEIARSFMVMEMDMDAFGTTTMEMYMAMEGTSFTEIRMIVDGQEIPSEFLLPEMLEGIFEDAMNMPDVEAEAFLSAEIEVIDGYTHMHVVLDGQLMMDFAMAAVDGMLADLGMDLEITMGDVPMTIIVDANDNPVSMTMEMDMTMIFDGEEMTMTSVSEFIFIAFGDDVVINFA